MHGAANDRLCDDPATVCPPFRKFWGWRGSPGGERHGSALTSTFAAPFVGMLADRYGRHPIILFSLAGDILAFSGYRFAALRLGADFAARPGRGVYCRAAASHNEHRRRPGSPNWPAQWIGIVNGGAAAGWIQGTAGSLGNLLGPALVVLLDPLRARRSCS